MRWIHDDRGTALVLTLVLAPVLLVALAGVLQLGALRVAGARVRAAADLATLVAVNDQDDAELARSGALRLASDAADVDWCVRLCDVDPSGVSKLLNTGALKGSHVISHESPSPLEPEEVYEFEVEVWPIANLFKRGHRLRLDITGSNFPHFDVNPNSGEPEGEWQQPRIARNRVFAEGARPSHILLPIIPSGE